MPPSPLLLTRHPITEPTDRVRRSSAGIGRTTALALIYVGVLFGGSACAANQATQAKTPAVVNASLEIHSASALVVDERGNRIYGKNTREVKPIASITKLMTVMVVVDSGVSLETPITIREQDRDTLRHSSSRLRIDQATLPRREMMMVALIGSDNRAAAALARTSPGGTRSFVEAMNRKAQSLGMHDTWFADSTGLDNRNRSTAEDLIKLVQAAAEYPLIRQASSRGELTVYPFRDHTPLEYRNTNALVRNPSWDVEVSKTGFINEAGRCLVMQTQIGDRRFYVVFLDAVGKLTPVGDSNRLRTWLVGGQHIAGK